VTSTGSVTTGMVVSIVRDRLDHSRCHSISGDSVYLDVTAGATSAIEQ
jgi:hypothetical protein